MRNINFTNKETYLAYRSDWKVEYKELSQKIKDLKWLRSTRNQAHSKVYQQLPKGTHDYYGLLYDGITEILKNIPKYDELIKKYLNKEPGHCFSDIIEWELIKQKKEATTMLAELKTAKVEANRQYLEQKLLTVNNI